MISYGIRSHKGWAYSNSVSITVPADASIVYTLLHVNTYTTRIANIIAVYIICRSSILGCEGGKGGGVQCH